MTENQLNATLRRTLLGLSVACLLLAPVALFVGQSEPSVDPIAPPADLLEVVAGEVEAFDEPESNDFVARPLFEESRTPYEPVVVAKPDKGPAQAPEPAKIDDATLAGTFVSDGVQGAIIAAGKERHRVLVGETFREWKLQSVEPRAANFVSAGGFRARTARLDMALLTSLPPGQARAATRAVEADSSATDEPSAPGSSEEAIDASASNGQGKGRKKSSSVMGMLTFEKMYGEDTPKDSPKKGDKE